jgi:hypothetical protein
VPRVQVPVPAPPAPSQPAAPVVEAPAQVAKTRFSRDQKLFVVVGALFLILIIMLVSMMNSRNQLQTKVDKLSNPTSSSTDEVKRLTTEIGAVYELPTGETPTLATVSDVSKVKNQAFFKNAQNGDEVLLYSKAGQAILWRPSIKKIIAVAPVDLGGSSTANSSSSATAGAK